MGKFDSKLFNEQAFGHYVKTVPNTKKNELAKSGAIGANEEARNSLANQTGSLYTRIPYFGRISPETSQNNDGATNITSSNTTTYDQGFITASRMDSWTERSFSKNITAGTDFMANVGNQIADYKMAVRQNMILAMLRGIFAMNTVGTSVAAKSASEFITKHTYDITANAGDSGCIGAATLNSAMQQACGDNKDIFSLAIMHSVVATHLENLKLLDYMKYTDKDGVTRDLKLGTWNGRTVLIDDDMPTALKYSGAGVYTVTIGGTLASGDKITVAGETVTLNSTSAASTSAAATAVVTALGTMDEYTVSRTDAVITFTEKSGYYGTGAPEVSITSTAGTVTAATTTEPASYTEYTTYVLGEGAVTLDDIGDSHPYEMSRDPKTNGGQDTLFVRDRFICGAEGLSFEKPSTLTASASNTDLSTGTNWNVINDGVTAISHKAIPILRILSRG